jgi:hypothetical protein
MFSLDPFLLDSALDKMSVFNPGMSRIRGAGYIYLVTSGTNGKDSRPCLQLELHWSCTKCWLIHDTEIWGSGGHEDLVEEVCNGCFFMDNYVLVFQMNILQFDQRTAGQVLGSKT